VLGRVKELEARLKDRDLPRDGSDFRSLLPILGCLVLAWGRMAQALSRSDNACQSTEAGCCSLSRRYRTKKKRARIAPEPFSFPVAGTWVRSADCDLSRASIRHPGCPGFPEAEKHYAPDRAPKQENSVRRQCPTCAVRLIGMALYGRYEMRPAKASRARGMKKGRARSCNPQSPDCRLPVGCQLVRWGMAHYRPAPLRPASPRLPVLP
jgi:hypothetical protein